MKNLAFLTENQNLRLRQLLDKKSSRFTGPTLMPHELVTKAGVDPNRTLDVMKALEAQRLLVMRATVYHTNCAVADYCATCFFDDPKGEHGQFHCEHCDEDFDMKDARVVSIGILK